jgi:hypothetical protein
VGVKFKIVTEAVDGRRQWQLAEYGKNSMRDAYGPTDARILTPGMMSVNANGFQWAYVTLLTCRWGNFLSGSEGLHSPRRELTGSFGNGEFVASPLDQPSSNGYSFNDFLQVRS